MKTRISILASERKESVYEGGRKSVKYVCKCVIHAEDGSVDVGTLNVPERFAPEGVLPGEYAVDYKAGRGFSDDKIGGQLALFEPLQTRSAARPVPAQGDSKAA